MSTLIEVMVLVLKWDSKDDDEALLFVSSVKVLGFFYELNNISWLITMYGRELAFGMINSRELTCFTSILAARRGC
jgi:hypothetical protein